tara:strand:- start:1200 stop:1430 length:231 start_codon:yes stop_codon:yes gene_type:complete
MNVIINDIKYVPENEIKPLDDERTKEVLEHLTSIRYFNLSTNKMRAQVWDAINAISPDIAKLDETTAYDLIHGEDK